MVDRKLTELVSDGEHVVKAKTPAKTDGEAVLDPVDLLDSATHRAEQRSIVGAERRIDPVRAARELQRHHLGAKLELIQNLG